MIEGNALLWTVTVVAGGIATDSINEGRLADRQTDGMGGLLAVVAVGEVAMASCNAGNFCCRDGWSTSARMPAKR